MSTLYTAMLDDVLPDLNGCSSEMAVNALRNTCIELLQKSWIYTQDMDSFATQVGVAQYDLDIFTGYRVVGVVSVTVDGKRIEAVNELTLNNSVIDIQSTSGAPEGYFLVDSSTIQFVRVPDKAQTVKIKVALAPTTKSTGIETFIYDLYSEAIAAGAKARLMNIPHKPYSDAGASISYRREFAAAVTEAKWRAYKSQVGSQIQVELR